MRHGRRGCGGCLIRFLPAPFACALLAVCAIAWALKAPFAGFRGETFVDVERGAGARGIAEELAGAGVIRWRWQFDLVRLLTGRNARELGEVRDEIEKLALSAKQAVIRQIGFVMLINIDRGITAG